MTAKPPLIINYLLLWFILIFLAAPKDRTLEWLKAFQRPQTQEIVK